MINNEYLHINIINNYKKKQKHNGTKQKKRVICVLKINIQNHPCQYIDKVTTIVVGGVYSQS